MNSMANKHVGIHTEGGIYNYSNTLDAVVCDTIDAFRTKLKGNYGKDVCFSGAPFRTLPPPASHAAPPNGLLSQQVP
jgi:hypothetical protein